MYEGQSGSGMWSQDNQSICAIVTGAVTVSDSYDTTFNVGINLNAFVYNTIRSWYNEDASETLPEYPASAPAPAAVPAARPMAAPMAGPVAAPIAAPKAASMPSAAEQWWHQ